MHPGPFSDLLRGTKPTSDRVSQGERGTSKFHFEGRSHLSQVCVPPSRSESLLLRSNRLDSFEIRCRILRALLSCTKICRFVAKNAFLHKTNAAFLVAAEKKNAAFIVAAEKKRNNLSVLFLISAFILWLSILFRASFDPSNRNTPNIAQWIRNTHSNVGF